LDSKCGVRKYPPVDRVISAARDRSKVWDNRFKSSDPLCGVPAVPLDAQLK
jgi:hypothetical protein